MLAAEVDEPTAAAASAPAAAAAPAPAPTGGYPAVAAAPAAAAPAQPFTLEPLVLGGSLAAPAAAASTPAPVQVAAAPAAAEGAPAAAFAAAAAEPAAVEAPAAAAPPVEAAAAPAAEEAAAPAEGGEPVEETASQAAESDPSAPKGFLGRMKDKVGQSEKFQKASQFVQDKAQAIKETEKYQKTAEYVKQKTTELAENERLQKGIEKAKETASKVTEKTKEGVDGVKARYQNVKEGVGGVWSKGKGSMERVKNKVRNGEWRGSAKDTLAMEERVEQWKDMKVQGAEEMTVPARTEHTSAYHVAKGSTLRWTFRVKEHDIGFGVRVRVQEWGGAREDDVLEVERYDCQDTISGSWVADENRTIILAFDNKYSKLRGKTVAYMVGTEKPPVFTEPSPAAAAAPAAEADAGAAAAAAAPAPEAAAAAASRPIV